MRKKVEIYLKDLSKEKQDEILEKFGDVGDYDTLPVATLYEDPNDVE